MVETTVHRLCMVGVMLCTLSSQHVVAGTMPDLATLQRWWGTQEAFTVDKWHEITINNQPAGLVEVTFTERARTMTEGILLVRPAQQQVTELPQGGRVSTIRDLNRDGTSEVELTSSSLAQGILEGVRYLVSFPNGQVQVLQQTSFGDNSGNCGEAKWQMERELNVPHRQKVPCVSTGVEWGYWDLDGDGSEELLETVTVAEWFKEDQADFQSTQHNNEYWVFRAQEARQAQKTTP